MDTKLESKFFMINSPLFLSPLFPIVLSWKNIKTAFIPTLNKNIVLLCLNNINFFK